MREADVHIDGLYRARVGVAGDVVRVRILGAHPRREGWAARTVLSNRLVRIRDASQLIERIDVEPTVGDAA